MRLHYGCAVELAKIIASLTGYYATSPYICGYVIPESRVGSAIGVFYAPCCRKGRVANKTLAIEQDENEHCQTVYPKSERQIINKRKLPLRKQERGVGEPCPKGYVLCA